MLSIGLKLVCSAKKIDRAKLKKVLEEYEGKARLLWHPKQRANFRTDKFRPKSSFNPRIKDATIKMYLIYLEERLLDIEIPCKRYNYLAKDMRDASYSLNDDPCIINKGADLVSIVACDRDYLKETCRQLDDREVYEEVPNYPNILIITIMKDLEKISLWGD